MPRDARYNYEATVRRAAHLFWERGYHACSMKQLETTLDMRPGSIYAAFGSKEGLFRAALMTYYEDLAEGMTQRLIEHASVLEGLAAYLRGLAAQAISPQENGSGPVSACMMVKTLLELTADTPVLNEAVNDLFDRVESELVRLLEQARDAGELFPETDCTRLARLWQAQIIGLRTFAHRRVAAETVTDLAEDMIAALQQYAYPMAAITAH